MNIQHKSKDFLRTIFPANRWELIFFLFFLLGYGILASILALNYRLVFDARIPWDAYFSFDNRAIVLNGGSFERHPLSKYFFDALRKLALWISGQKMNADFRLVLSLFSVLTVSLGNIQILKYLKNIIQLPKVIAGFLTLFFGIFTTPLLLSFTPETYTYTFFLLVLFNYYAALKLQKNEPLSLVALTFSAITIGGFTITNVVKVYIPMLFEKGIWRNLKKSGWFFGRALISVSVFIFLFLWRLNFEYEKIFTKAETQYDKFSNAKITPFWDMVFSWFLGGTVVFPSFEVRDYHSQTGFQFKAIFMETYSSFWCYFFVGLIFSFVLWSYIVNFKNRFVQILMLSFLVDITIHCVLRFGLHTAYIYGGHYVFVVPLLLGWLFFAYKNRPKMLSFIGISLSLSFIFILACNAYRMAEFFDFVNLYYC